jgi:hypothetical protein
MVNVGINKSQRWVLTKEGAVFVNVPTYWL